MLSNFILSAELIHPDVDCVTSVLLTRSCKLDITCLTASFIFEGGQPSLISMPSILVMSSGFGLKSFIDIPVIPIFKF